MDAIADKWNKTEYRRIVSAELQGSDIVVRFADGTWAGVQAKRLMPDYRSDLNWSALTFTPYEIIVPAGSASVEIPWSTVRVLTDADYSAHVAEVAEQEARQVGRRLRELREARNLGSKELAERAGITPQSLSRIEHGHHDVVFTTLQRILAAMGCSLRDLAPASGLTMKAPPRLSTTRQRPKGARYQKSTVPVKK
jgi:DNA-binding Xre family transcriptional regulator